MATPALFLLLSCEQNATETRLTLGHTEGGLSIAALWVRSWGRYSPFSRPLKGAGKQWRGNSFQDKLINKLQQEPLPHHSQEKGTLRINPRDSLTDLTAV